MHRPTSSRKPLIKKGPPKDYCLTCSQEQPFCTIRRRPNRHLTSRRQLRQLLTFKDRSFHSNSIPSPKRFTANGEKPKGGEWSPGALSGSCNVVGSSAHAALEDCVACTPVASPHAPNVHRSQAAGAPLSAGPARLGPDAAEVRWRRHPTMILVRSRSGFVLSPLET
jgi:hypothetical protein